MSGGNNVQELVVQTNSYQIHERSPAHKTISVNVVKSDMANGESPTEFTLIDAPEAWVAAFVMNDKGETVDRISISRPPK
jgi:hypothetical protein